jgi:ABC-type oligopeptide transport system ATPase subunit
LGEKMSSELLRVESLVKYFPLDKNSFVAAVNGVSFTIGRGETLGLVGESGSGKTTVGRCVLRLLQPTRGEIWYEGTDITNLSEGKLRSLRSEIQLVFQDPVSSLNPGRTVGSTIEEPLILQGMGGEARAQRLRETLAAVHL